MKFGLRCRVDVLTSEEEDTLLFKSASGLLLQKLLIFELESDQLPILDFELKDFTYSSASRSGRAISSPPDV